MAQNKTHRIAVIPGDGIGTEVVPEGLRALEAAARRFDIDLEFEIQGIERQKSVIEWV